MPVAYLIRHGQASFGATDYDVLSDVGHRQSELVGQALVARGVAPDRIVTGSLKRQRDTAVTAIAAAPFHLQVGVDPRWDEYDHMALLRAHPLAAARSLASRRESGKSVQRALDAALLAWLRSGSSSSAGLTWSAYRAAAVGALDTLLDSLGPGGTGLAFTSGGVIAAICTDLLGLEAAGFVALNRVSVNTGITKIVRGRRGTSLISFNEHAHLEHPDAIDPTLLTYR